PGAGAADTPGRVPPARPEAGLLGAGPRRVAGGRSARDAPVGRRAVGGAEGAVAVELAERLFSSSPGWATHPRARALARPPRPVLASTPGTPADHPRPRRPRPPVRPSRRPRPESRRRGHLP